MIEIYDYNMQYTNTNNTHTQTTQNEHFLLTTIPNGSNCHWNQSLRRRVAMEGGSP